MKIFVQPARSRFRSTLLWSVSVLALSWLHGCDEADRAYLRGKNLTFSPGETRLFRVSVHEDTGRWRPKDPESRASRYKSSLLMVSCDCPSFLKVRDVGRLEVDVKLPGAVSSGRVGVFGGLEMSVSQGAPLGTHDIEIAFTHPHFSAAVHHKWMSDARSIIDEQDTETQKQLMKFLESDPTPEEFHRVLVELAGGARIRLKARIRIVD